MKLSLVISTSDAAFDALAFKGDLERGMEMAREIGYNAVEIAVRDPSVVDAAKINELKERMNLEISAIGTGQAFLAEGLSLAAKDEEKRRGAVERLKKHVDLASEIGGFVIIGLIRGTVGKREREEAVKLLIEGLREVGIYASGKGVSLVIEPLNRYESDYLNTADEVAEVIEKVGLENVGLLLDTFHMNIEERSFEETIEKHALILKHFHVADSNRWAPGYGHIDFPSIFKALKGVGYDGYVSVECLPLPGGPREAAVKAHEYLRKILGELVV